jgi:hypothetical protein
MDGKDMQRVVGAAQRVRPPRDALEAMRRNTGPLPESNGQTCAELARDPERRLEPLRRGTEPAGGRAR